jgi:hypothetical protein
MKKVKQRGSIYLHFMGDILGVGFMTAVATVSLTCLVTLAWVSTL